MRLFNLMDHWCMQVLMNNREGSEDARPAASGIIQHLAAMRIWHIFNLVTFVTHFLACCTLIHRATLVASAGLAADIPANNHLTHPYLTQPDFFPLTDSEGFE